MSNAKYKIIYSLQIHIALQALGFAHETEMKNPKNPRFNCWVYEETPELLAAFDGIVKGGRKHGN